MIFYRAKFYEVSPFKVNRKIHNSNTTTVIAIKNSGHNISVTNTSKQMDPKIITPVRWVSLTLTPDRFECSLSKIKSVLVTCCHHQPMDDLVTCIENSTK